MLRISNNRGQNLILWLVAFSAAVLAFTFLEVSIRRAIRNKAISLSDYYLGKQGDIDTDRQLKRPIVADLANPVVDESNPDQASIYQERSETKKLLVSDPANPSPDDRFESEMRIDNYSRAKDESFYVGDGSEKILNFIDKNGFVR